MSAAATAAGEWLWREMLVVLDGGQTASMLPLVLLSAALFQGMMMGSRVLFAAALPRYYNALSRKDHVDWDVRVVSTIFSTFVCGAALYVLDHPDIMKDPLFAVHDHTAYLSAIAAGYFLWDVTVCVYHSDLYEPAFLAHAVVCFFVYFFSLRPFLTRFAAVFLLFEASTVPLNFHWFIDKVGLGDSPVKVINAIFLMIVYFLARICFGLYNSYSFFELVFFTEWHRVPKLLAFYYGAANLLLNGLNLFWFSKMVRMAIRVATGAPPRSKQGKNGTAAAKKH